MLSSSIISILSLPDGEDAAATVGCATKKGKDQKWTQVKWFYWLCSARAWACVDVTGVMRVKTAWDSSWRITERWTQAECVPLERRSNLDIYRKPSLCLFFLPFRNLFYNCILCFPSYASRRISINLRGQEGLQPVTAWPMSGHLGCGLGEISPSVYLCLPATPAPCLSALLSFFILTILSLFLACLSAVGERHDVLWQIPWTVISFKLAQTSVHL